MLKPRTNKNHCKHRCPGLTAIFDIANHLILGIVIDAGPKPDPIDAKQTLIEAFGQQRFLVLLGDAGHESAGFHSLCLDILGIRSIILTTERARPRQNGKPLPVKEHGRRL